MKLSGTARERLTKALSLIFSVALFLLGLEAGYYLKIQKEAPGLVVEIQEHPPKEEPQVAGAATSDPQNPSQGCSYVGSKNSDLYHLPTCAPAKRIKPENMVCFTSAEDALGKGYRPGCLE